MPTGPSFSSLNSVQFEELCYELLDELGYTNLSWRKGTPKNASPSDQGRDLEAIFNTRLPDGSHHPSRWFIECKHHTRGVPETKLQGIFAWADIEKPDFVLIICSGFLSNQAKSWISQKEKQCPGYNIRVWEFKDLERRLQGRSHLLKKCGILNGADLSTILHPNHLYFLENPLSLIGVGEFVEILDSLWFGWTFLAIINPESTILPEQVRPDQTLGELMPPITVHEFKKVLRDKATVFFSPFLVTAAISQALTWLLERGNKTALADKESQQKRYIEALERQISLGTGDIKTKRKCLSVLQNTLATLPDSLKEGYKDYTGFCETIIPKIYEAEIGCIRREGEWFNRTFGHLL